MMINNIIMMVMLQSLSSVYVAVPGRKRTLVHEGRNRIFIQ